MLFATAPKPLPAGGAATQVSATATHSAAPIAASLITSHTVLYAPSAGFAKHPERSEWTGQALNITWTSDAWLGAQFTALSVPQAELYDEQDNLIATGAVQAQPADDHTAVALALGDTLTYTIQGTGSASFYAPATSGLGVGGTWQTYTAQVQSATTYGVGLQGAVVNVNGRQYSGALTLVTTAPVTLQGYGRTLAPNFSQQAAIQASDASVRVGGSANQRISLSGYTGAITITEHTPELDMVELDGLAARDLSLATTPAQSSLTPLETAVFQTDIRSNQDDTYTVTVTPPWGWQAHINARGQITITPPLDAAPGDDYTVLVTAQSVNSADPLFSTALHTITVTPHHGMQLAVAPDPLTTVPWGPAFPDAPDATINNGQAQVPGAAYIATITNTSTSAHTFAVQVAPDNFPTDWIMLGSAGRAASTTLTLPAGGVGRLGVYVSPVGLQALPPVGAQYPFSVQANASDEPGLSQSTPALFTMPAVPFNYLEADPLLLYAAPNTPARFDVHLTNVGNVSDTFGVNVYLPDPIWWSTSAYSLPLASGATTRQTIEFTPFGASPGDEEIIRVQSPAPGGPYIQEEYVGVRIVGPCAFETYQAARAATRLDDLQLNTALDNLTFQLDRWEQNPDDALRQRTIAALNDVIGRLKTPALHPQRGASAGYALVDTSDLEALVAAPAPDDFCNPMSDLQADLTTLASHDVALSVSPGAHVTLPGQPVTYTVALSARGDLTTTYETNLQMGEWANGQISNTQSPISNIQSPFTVTLSPGQSVTTALVITPNGLGIFMPQVTVVAQQDALVQRHQTVALRAVEAWLKLTAVSADPAFVEVGDNSAELSVAIANLANLPRPAMAHVTIEAGGGNPVWSSQAPLDVQPGGLRRYALGQVNTGGWATGPYTVSVELRDAEGAPFDQAHGTPFPQGSGHTYLVIGQGLQAGHAISPALVPPGTVTATIQITTQWQQDNPLGGYTPGQAVPPGQDAAVVQRYELEGDSPDIVTSGNWVRSDATWSSAKPASAGGCFRSSMPGDTLSLNFDGSWVGVGFIEWSSAGLAQVQIDDGTLVSETLDLYGATARSVSRYYSVPSSSHVITITALNRPGAYNARVYADLIDVWNGDLLPPGRYEEDALAVSRSSSDTWQEVMDPRASGGRYLADYGSHQNNLWFGFTGDSVTYLALTQPGATDAEVFVDGQSQGAIDLSYPWSETPRPLHYTGLGDGPHVLRVASYANATVDAFDAPANPLAGAPAVEWHDDAPAGGTGVMSSAAAADLDGNGVVEIAVTSKDGHLTVYRGDGADAGSGSPLLWSAPVGIANAPALADLDGDGDAEIVVGSDDGLYAWHHDGALMWFTDTLKSYWWGSAGTEPSGGAAIANLDHDQAPEIVVEGYDGLYVVEADGRVAWHYATADNTMMTSPLLADLSGDGQLDILAAWGNALYLFDYAQQPAPALAWTRTVTPGLNVWGAPAVADLDGDAAPEIAMAWDGYVELLEADGSLAWSYYTGGEKPGSVAIADTDGDGEPEIVVSMRVEITPTSGMYGRVYVLNADGSLLWSAPAHDDTNSSSGVSVHDLDGDGVWEIIWNGYEQGLTVYRGDDGAVLFNEPLIQSHTMLDYPIVADVDGDGHVEIVTGDPGGVYVVGHDAAWAPARPLWNQYSYHITNVADDLAVPPVEPPSWASHNTYHTQYPRPVAAPHLSVNLTHTLALAGVQVLSDTLVPAPTNASDPDYYWHYRQFWYETGQVHFDVRLDDVQPGELRQVSQGTVISYTHAGGHNKLQLPPLYVQASHILALAPETQVVGPGGATHYDVTLSNPTGAVQTYALSVAGLPEGLPASLPPTVTLQAGETLSVPLVVAALDAPPAAFDLSVVAASASGGQDAAQATLTVTPPTFALAIAPAGQTARNGAGVTYTLTLTNLESSARTYALDVAGLAGNELSLPEKVQVAAGESVAVPLYVTARTYRGLYPFDVSATLDELPGTRYASAALTVLDEPGVALGLSPAVVTAGQASPVSFTLALTNTGTIADGYDLNANLPAGWGYEFRANGASLDHVDLTPHVFNALQFLLVVVPPDGTPPGDYPVSVSATSTHDPNVSASDGGSVNVSPRGVTLAINPVVATMHPQGSHTWAVTVANTGDLPDTFELTASGIMTIGAQFDANPVSLEAGAATVVQLTAQNLDFAPFGDFALPQTYPLAVHARSQADPTVVNYATGEVTFLGFEDAALGVAPVSVVLTDTTVARYLTLITNTGNLDTVYHLSADSSELVDLQLELDELYLPAHTTAGILLTARASANGLYPIRVQADSTSGPASATFTATLIVEGQSAAQSPLVEAGPDQNVNEGQSVSFSGLITDPDSPSGHTILWTFGDGATASGTLTPVHTYDDDGTYPVTLTVTDTSGLDGSDSLSVNVANVAPSVSVTAVLTTAQVNQLITFTGSFSDPGLADTHVLTWTFGDTSSPLEELALSLPKGSEGEPITHSYSAPGVYTATLSVRDDDGGLGTDAVVIHVSAGGPARDVAVTFTPGAATALPGQPLTYTLDVENRGYLTTTYVGNLQMGKWINGQISDTQSPISNFQSPFTVTLSPDQVLLLPVVVTPTALGYYTLHAHVQAVEDEAVWATADAGLNVVEALVRVLSVSANPSFVESGAGTTTSLSVEVANVANVYREVTARARALNAGGTQVWSADLPLALRTGAARGYSLGTVDASAWAAGVYTLSVELLDGDSARVPDGLGYGYLGVDQALQGTHSVNPATINGDAITATIAITTEISESASQQISESANQRVGEWANRRMGEWMPLATHHLPPATRPPGLASLLFQGGSGVVRYEENDAQVVVSGSWSTCLSSWTAAKVGSASSCRRSDTLSSTLGLTFTGTWAGVGFIADAYSGLARVQIDGGALLSETVDLYSNETRSVSRYYSVPSGTHFIRVVVLDQRNPLSAGDRVYVDFVDTWDGASMSTGTFEAEDDPFLGQSKNWNTLSAAVASDGAYLYNFYAHRSLWFPFTGDSCTYQALANENGDLARLSLDGAYLGHVDLFHPGSELVTRTFSFDHLGDGPHVLQVENPWDGHYTYADAFITPGTASSPLTPTGVVRLEENDPTLRFDGRPFYQSDGSWDVRDYDQASAGHTVRSETSGDELSLTFQSDWLGVGFYTDDDSGRVRLLVDDGATVSETLDLYSASPDVSSHYYSLPTGTLTHTLRLLVLGERNASSSGDWVEVDLVDLWTGNPLPSDRYEEDAPSVFLSHNWREMSDARASGGRYLDDVIPNQSNLWFGFTGDSITLLALTHSSASEAEVLIDGQSQGAIDQAYAFTPSPRPFHYSGLGDGPHVLQVKATSNTTVDAFDVPLNPSAGAPAVEWYDEAPGWGTGVEATAAAADLDDDGDVEIVVSAVDEVLYVYQGDGTDTGLGSALLWTATVGVASAPAVVELDGTPDAEIVVASDEGLYAWHHDGTLMWFTDTLKSYWPLLLVEPAGGVAVANLDGEATPEIVVGGYDGLYVVEADGSVAWHYATADDVRMTPPLLADVSGDGQLDILAGWDNNLYLFDYAHQPAPALVWTRTVTSGLDTWGAPAVADLDGDAAPEIAMAWDGYVELLEADGSLAWSYSTGGTKPGSVAIADTDGDEAMEIIVSMRVEITPTSGTYGRVFVLNADGSLLWSAPAHDDTGSSSGVSVHDLDGDGTWEVIWNGYGQGLTIYRGSDGAVLFNEPLIQSYTMHDYPIVADVDGDDHVEIVTGDTEGLYVIGFDAAWGPARPLWNQYDYHITNVADDLQVPPHEPDSWAAHNTYRTQTPEQNPAPVYPLALTHTLALSGVMVLSDTWSAPPGGVAPTLHWTYGQFWYEAAHRTSLDVRLPDLHPGQVRQVSQGSEATAWLPGGAHGLTLPPLYLESPHVVALEPPDQTLNPGGRADYVVSLYNPAPHGQTYTLTVVGLPGGFQAPGRVLNVPAGATLTATLPLTTSADAAPGQYAWMAVVQTEDGEQDTVQATLALSDPLAGWPEGDDYRPRVILTWAERGTLASARPKWSRYGMSW